MEQYSQGKGNKLNGKCDMSTKQGFDKAPSKFIALNVGKMLDNGIGLTKESLEYMLNCVVGNDAFIHLVEVSVDGESGDIIYKTQLMLTVDNGNVLYDVGQICFSSARESTTGCTIDWQRSMITPDDVIGCFQSIAKNN